MHELSQSALNSDLPAGRRAFLGAVLAAVVGGHLWCLLSSTEERWPFSRYAMYSEARDPVQAELYVLVGVDAADPSLEIELSENWQYLRPHYRGTLHRTFKTLALGSDRERLEAAAGDCLRRYELRRTDGLHDGPALRAARVYRYTWRYADVDPATRRPTHRELLVEALLPRSGRAP
jgi:hypothetical protein